MKTKRRSRPQEEAVVEETGGMSPTTTIFSSDLLTPEEERELVTDIEDCLIELYVAQKEAIREGDRCRAIELEFEIRELRRDRDRIKHWAVV